MNQTPLARWVLACYPRPTATDYSDEFERCEVSSVDVEIESFAHVGAHHIGCVCGDCSVAYERDRF